MTNVLITPYYTHAQEVKGLFKLKSAQEAEQKLEHLLERHDKTIKPSKPLRRLAKTLRRHRDQLFTYMDLGIDGTNNLAEREIRPFVIFRKRAQCFRSRASAEAHAGLFTVWRTRQRNGQPRLKWVGGSGASLRSLSEKRREAPGNGAEGRLSGREAPETGCEQSGKPRVAT